MRPTRIQDIQEALYAEAKMAVPPLEDGTRPFQPMLEALANLIEVDPRKEQLRKAKTIIDSLSDPDGTRRVDGQIEFEFVGGQYAYKPDRLIQCNGYIVEQDKAPFAFKLEALHRAKEKLAEQELWVRRAEVEIAHYQDWSTQERKKGRPVLDLTWGNCVRESSFWKKK